MTIYLDGGCVLILCKAWSWRARMQHRLTPEIHDHDAPSCAATMPCSHDARLQIVAQLSGKPGRFWISRGRLGSAGRAVALLMTRCPLRASLATLDRCRKSEKSRTMGGGPRVVGRPLRAAYSGTLLQATSVKDFASSNSFLHQ